MSVKVAVRVRPFNQREKFLGCLNCIQMKGNTTILINPRDRAQKEHQFTFDYSLWSHDGFEELENGYLFPIDDRFVDQKRIFKELGEEIIKNAWNGFNCCLFAYGQTGAGKSYSMIGYESNRGIVPMACERIFEGISKKTVKGKKEFQLTISMLQIYNEKVQDLFVHTSKRPPNGLRIRENKRVGIYVEGITKYEVHSYKEIERRMEEGAKNRSLASTLMNEYSSRAHTIVVIEFVQKEFITEQKMNKKTSTLNLVDLAGSERVSKTGISDKDRLKEASQINKSLHTLGRVIEHLAEIAAAKKNSNTIQVPYRDSVLTRILETALGGNSMTTMICAISPANDNYEETLSTLRYADQTKKIKNKPIINESAVDKIIRELREENERLKEMLRVAKMKGVNIEKMMEGGASNSDEEDLMANIQQVQSSIRKNMQSFAIMTDDFGADDDDGMIKEFVDVPDPNDFYSGDLSFDNPFPNSSNSAGYGMNTSDLSITTVGNSRANAFITNLSEDRLLNYKIKYSCEEELYIGNKNLRDGSSMKHRLILCGLGVEDRHARIYQLGKDAECRYFIESLSESAGEYTMVNGRPLQYEASNNPNRKRGLRELFHNDRLIFGTNSVFLFKNLSQQAQNKSSPAQNSPAQNSPAQSKSPAKKGKEVGSGGDNRNSETSAERRLKVRSSLLLLDDSADESMLLDWNDEEDGHNSIIDGLRRVKTDSSAWPTKESSENSSVEVEVMIEEERGPLPEQIDYEFAINERQCLFETSTVSSSSSGIRVYNPNASAHNIQMQNKLDEIEHEFQELIKENERKLKEKEESFREEIRKIEIERQIERAKMKQQLRQKEEEAKKIALEKQRIQRIRDDLLQERQNRRKAARDSMLLPSDQGARDSMLLPSDQGARDSMLLPSEEDSAGETGPALMGEVTIEYVDRHHFHYDYNLVNGGEGWANKNVQVGSNEKSEGVACNSSTTNNYHVTNNHYNTSNSEATTIHNRVNETKPQSIQSFNEGQNILSAQERNTNSRRNQESNTKIKLKQESAGSQMTTDSGVGVLQTNADQSILLDGLQSGGMQPYGLQSGGMQPYGLQSDRPAQQYDESEPQGLDPSGASQQKMGKLDNMYEPISAPVSDRQNPSKFEIERSDSDNFRKKSLNLTDILYGTAYSPPHNIERVTSTNEESMLLNMTSAEQFTAGLYRPTLEARHSDISLNYSLLTCIDENSPQKHISPVRNDVQAGYGDSFFEESKEQQLNKKIQQLEEKLKLLENSKQENQQNIRNLRKSFAIGADKMTNSNNFFGEDFEEMNPDELMELSLIERRKESQDELSVDQDERSFLEAKIKLNMVQAQNQNIINERNLQVRKRKREAEQIKLMFVKREKRELQKQLVELIPMLQKFNLWGREMNRNLQGKIHIEYRNFTNYEIVEALKSNKNYSKANLMIKILNYEEGRTYKWPVEIFQNRYEIIESLFERFLENPGADLFSDKSKDPFWDPRDFQTYAVGYLTLQHLSYGLSFEGEVSFVDKGQVVGYAEICLHPTVDRKTSKLREKLHQIGHNGDQIQDPRQLLENDLMFTISIDQFRPTEHLPVDKIEKYFISYEIMEDNYRNSTFKTPEMAMNKTEINYMFKHSMKNITEHTLAYLADCPLRLSLNLILEYDDELSNLTSSFIAQSQSALNTSSVSSKSGSVSVSSVQVTEGGGSPPGGFSKKKVSVMIENTQVLDKLDREFSSEKKKAKLREEAKNAKLSQEDKKKHKDSCRHS